MQFIIIHGSFSSPDANWFPQLKEDLELLGQTVFAPQFPVDDYDSILKQGKNATLKNQNLSNWLTEFSKLIPSLDPTQKIVLVAHSLGPVFSLHAIDKFNLNLDCAIFVSPFMSDPNIPDEFWPIRLANTSFYKTDFKFNLLKQRIPLSYVLYSNTDPYVDKQYPLDFAHKLGSSLIPVIKAGHMNSEVNLNEFPLVLELCKSRLDLSLYQKYLAHRSELFQVNYNNKNHAEEVIYLDPTEVRDEGIFHFRNMRKGGFCTCITGTDFWDNQSTYMKEARKAAARTQFTRVFVVIHPSDLSVPRMRQQIQLDLEAGINVYLVDMNDIKLQISNPDFGIWDDEYRCVVTFNDQAEVTEIQLSSRKQDIAIAKEWQKLILDQAVKVDQISDIDQYLETRL
jgi:predicted alpha/beta hydrolase family esterase